ncbi:class I mannose-6-phosphate isomerase [Flavobacterium supellecticarium]|uniref:Phosphohexomutase n=1 Tax=Flavobacterium supellecticarium TaxID=2565924 RepID=A0A4S3ZXN7_9FLAO|nr:type I phosphomannose isomerase catalytic subunit [Flavobacterium supellecticarium]THF50601.1 class I mannose-6-phosphate isomerase [Flavobacterium supellecticarium]
MAIDWYPLLFSPILKERIWGGTKLSSLLYKDIVSQTTGESWEISTVPGDISIVRNGQLAGKSLEELLYIDPKALLGNKVYQKFGTTFPLLFKFLDAKEDLSIQLHPNDELARIRHNSFGKTEMWYVMQADPDSRIIVGFDKEASPEEYLYHLEHKTLTKILKEIKVAPGDVFFLETGTIHAIGAGIVIAEIQQTSDITYRVYDWDRVDAEGKSRELHIDLALDAIDYTVSNAKCEYAKIVNTSNPIVDCPYFTTRFIPLDGELVFQKTTDSFTVLVCTEGTFSIRANGTMMTFQKGDAVLIPAIMTDFELNGTASLLEIFIS